LGPWQELYIRAVKMDRARGAPSLDELVLGGVGLFVWGVVVAGEELGEALEVRCVDSLVVWECIGEEVTSSKKDCMLVMGRSVYVAMAGV